MCKSRSNLKVYISMSMKHFVPIIDTSSVYKSNNDKRAEKSPYEKRGIGIEYIIDRKRMRKQKGGGSVSELPWLRGVWLKQNAWRCQAVRGIILSWLNVCISMASRILSPQIRGKKSKIKIEITMHRDKFSLFDAEKQYSTATVFLSTRVTMKSGTFVYSQKVSLGTWSKQLIDR